MRRVFWLGIGVAVGVLVVRKLTKTAESYGPKGLAQSAKSTATGLLNSARAFADDVRDAMDEHEDELLIALATEVEPVRASGLSRHGAHE